MHENPVVFARCASYDPAALAEAVNRMFSALDPGEDFFRGKRVLFKPNLVLAKRPEQAATTHPAMIAALADEIYARGAQKIVLADSPGGPFSAAALSRVYRVCGMEGAHPRVKLNDDFNFRQVNSSGVKLKSFRMISAALDADVIVDIC